MLKLLKLQEHLKRHRQQWLFVSVLLVFSYLSMYALGRGDTENLGYSFGLFLTLYTVRLFSRCGFLIYIWVMFLVSLGYLPTGMMYGKLNLGIIISLYETHVSEVLEHLQSIPLKVYGVTIIYVLLFAFVLVLGRRLSADEQHKQQNKQQNQQRHKWHYFLAFIVVFAIVHRPIKFLYKEGKVSVHQLTSIKNYPLRFFFKFWDFHNEYYLQLNKLNQAKQQSASWQIVNTEPEYKNYVLVIGESMRRDYLSAYGYPLQTTPFLDTVNGTIFNHYVAPAYNTPLSLQRTLVQQTKREQFVYSNTIVTLAKQAGFQTYWLSNQGRMSRYDTLISGIAIHADVNFFTKKGEYNSTNTPDLALLPALQKALRAGQSSDKPQFIVLHLVGSHPKFCKRLNDDYQIDKIDNVVSKDLSCYLSSYRQTDELLKRVYGQLMQTQQPFSLMYLSDHGLSHSKRALQGVSLRHNQRYQQNYQVPFIIMSSDDKARRVVEVRKSGYRFVKAFSEWLGIEEKSLQYQPEFFNAQDDEIRVFDGSQVVDYDKLAQDPAIQPRQREPH